MNKEIEKQADDFFDGVPCKTAKVSKSAQTTCYIAVLRRTVPFEFGGGVETLTKIIKDTDTPRSLYEWAEKQNGNACHLISLEITKAI